MCRLAVESGAELKQCRALEIKSVNGKVSNVAYRNNDTPQVSYILADVVVVAAGAWSSRVCPQVSIGGAQCHSIVLKPKRKISPNMLFMTITGPEGSKSETPEIYPRPDGTVYSCEAADPTVALPDSTASVAVDMARCDAIHNALSTVSEPLRNSTRLASQVCFQPIVQHNGERRKNVGPLLGALDVTGLYVAAGHDSWGISNAPATGKLISELVFDSSPRSANIDSLSPAAVMERAKSSH